jgi:hypothetical protein
VSDNEAGKTLADRLYTQLPAWAARHSTSNRLTLIRADNGYKAGFVEYVTKTYDWWVDRSQKIRSRFCPPNGTLASRTKLRLAKFSKKLEQGIGENRRIFGGNAAFGI